MKSITTISPTNLRKLDNILSDGTQLNQYLACAYAEGFCEGEDASAEDKIKAWAYLIKTGLCWSLQGFYGRTANVLIERDLVTRKGEIVWKNIN